MYLPPPPDTLLLPNGNTPFGTYAGPMGPVDLSTAKELQERSPLWVRTHRKRWIYAFITSERYTVAAAVVHLGYAGTAFVTVLDRRTRAMLYEHSSRTLPSFVHVGMRSEQGCDAQFRGPTARVAFTRPSGSSRYTLAVDTSKLRLHATMESLGAPLPVSAICPVPDGAVNVTTKRVLMPTHGVLSVGGEIDQLQDAWGGMDYTHGALARHTQWRWAFGMGRSTDGRKVGFNLVDDFNQGKECVVWVDDTIVPTVSAHFEFDQDHPVSPWKIRTPDGCVALDFRPDAMHEERANLGLLQSYFVQPMGTFSGTILVPGQGDLILDGVSGVAENQRVTW